LKIAVCFQISDSEDFHEEFDTIPEAKKYVIRHKLAITWEQLVLGHAWDMASLRNNLHGYGESCLINGGADLAKTLCGGSTQRADIKICVGENRASSIL
jgi:hypothetical protein